MNTQGFLAALERQQAVGLVFELPDGHRVAPGYHVTEVTHASFQSMDCGGRQHAWRQTIVQLKGPSRRDEPLFMPVSKFLVIYRRVAASVPVREEDELRIEYADSERPAVAYKIGGFSEEPGALVVRLAAPGVSCKPQAQRVGPAPEFTELNVLSCC